MSDKRDLVLIVDDDEINRIMLVSMLEDDYRTIEAEDGYKALELIRGAETRPTAVLLDIMMPGMDGFEVLEHLKSDPDTSKIPVLLITASDSDENESRGLRAGAADFMPKPFNPDIGKARLANHIDLMRYQNELEGLVEEKTAELRRNHEKTLEVLADIVENRDQESGKHIKRTSELSRILVDKIMSDPKYADYVVKNDLDLQKADLIVRATALHDIGKIRISDSILLKPGRLTDEEFEKMKLHTSFGKEIIDDILEALGDNAGYLTYCREICHFHHERWDGRGYPTGLKDTEIPFSARLLSIVDVYDALVSLRPYKDPFPHDEAMAIIVESTGKQFDPVLVDAFVQVADKFVELESELRD